MINRANRINIGNFLQALFSIGNLAGIKKMHSNPCYIYVLSTFAGFVGFLSLKKTIPL